MCNKSSMGCVYDIWQSVFADIINHNLNLALTLIYTCYDRDLTPYWISDLTYTLLCAIHITVYLLYAYYFLSSIFL